MSWFQILRAKRFWLGLLFAIASVVLICAIGATLQQRGVVGAQAGMVILCLAYAVAGWLGTRIACHGKSGTLLCGAMVCALVLLLAVMLSLTWGSGPNFSDSWRQIACLAGGCGIGALRGAKTGKKRHKAFTKRPTAMRRVQRKA